MASNQSTRHHPHRWDVRKIVLCVALTGIIAAATPTQAQAPPDQAPATSETLTPTPTPSPTPENADVRAAGNTIASGDKPADPRHAKADLWGPVPTKDVSLVNLLPFFLPYFNNGPVFGLPGTVVGDFTDRTQLSGDWGGVRTKLARRGYFFDLYSTSAYQDVASGGLKTGSAFIQNTQLSINVDTGRAGLWSGGLFHVTFESRTGSSPQKTFTAGSVAPQYNGLTVPGPFFTNDVLPTEYFLVQSLRPKFSVILGKINVLNICDRTLFGNSYKDTFANLNFIKNPMALNFYNTTALAAVGVWTPTKSVVIAGGVLDPNSKANNLATDAFDKVNIYATSIFSYKLGNLPGQSWVQFNWTNKPKIDLAKPFGRLSPEAVPQAVGVLVGSPSTEGLPINFKSNSWVTIGNFSQYLSVKEDPEAVAQKLNSGQTLRGIGVFGRVGYAPAETNPITRDVSIALLAHGLSDRRKNDSFGVGFYHNGISRPLKDNVANLTGGTSRVKNEQGVEVFYDFAITPAIKLISSYQHIWNPLSADVTRNQRGADVFLARVNLTW
jgi:porin